MNAKDTRERLIDAAEELISQKGYARTSLREITSLANANLASVNYHFGSKEGVAEAVLKRHLEPLNQERMELLQAELDAAEAEGRNPDPRTLLHALYMPILVHASHGRRGGFFLRIFARLVTDPSSVFQKMAIKHLQGLLTAFYDALAVSLPNLNEEVIFARMILSFGAMAHAGNIMADRDKLEEVRDSDLPHFPEVSVLLDETIEYICRGMGVS